MTGLPLAFRWEDGAMHPIGRFARMAHTQFDPGNVYVLEEIEERSEASHRHEFAWLKEAWQTLPETIAADYPSPEMLRKRALISTGWCNIKDHVCNSRAEATRLATALRSELDDYTVVIVQDAVVRVLRAKSQSRSKMKAADFQRSKDDILRYVADLIGTEPETLEKQGSQARDGDGANNPAPVAA